MRIAILVWLFVFWPILATAAISESEPNNLFAEADPVQCGDTVVCAILSSIYDVDHFRFDVYSGDSIIAMTFDCAGSETNTLMVLYDNRDSVVAVNDNSGPGMFSRIVYRATYTGYYIVRVIAVVLEGDSAYNLQVYCPQYSTEDYDVCATARIIPSFPYYHEGTTRGMRDDCRGTAAPDVFYKFHNPAVSNMFITVCSDSFDARVQILGRCCGDFWDDASEGCGLGAELVSFSLAEGDYWIIVEGMAANQTGAFSIEVVAQMPGCPTPGPVVLATIGGYPFLGWPEATGHSY
ncbi:hypothetical protein EHM69_07630 [candidate division KSB1 bacterium]|nr:MAG: hypothetical protein EHM69_07630 [candidate division KSB1 bacterium]